MTHRIKFAGSSLHAAQLKKILGSKAFRAAPVPSKLLAALAKYTIDGRSVTQQTILDDYFIGKKPNHVGSNTRRLKTSLAAYFAAEGSKDDLVLSVHERDFTVYVQERAVAADATSPSLWKGRMVSMAQFARFLSEQCDADGTTEVERNKKLKQWVDAQDRFASRLSLSRHSAFKDFFASFQSSGSGTEGKEPALTFDEMATLAETLGIHRIMIDPLRSSEFNGDCVVLSLTASAGRGDHITPGVLDTSGEVDARNKAPRTRCAKGVFWTIGPRDTPAAPTAQARDDAAYGHGATYSIPNMRLCDTDTAFVRLYLQPGGYSTAHHHAGDELVLVLRGSVKVLMVDSGVTFVLDKHAYTHFYSEQTHAVYNTSSDDPAELFIIRFYQSDKATSRQGMRRQLWAFAQGQGQLSRPTIGWILAAAADRSIRKTVSAEAKGLPDEVLNRLGLARLLNRMPSPDAQRKAKFLRKRIGQGDNPTSTEWLAALERNLTRVPKRLLVDIAELYGIFDFLAFEFLFPSVPRQVVVARHADDETPVRAGGDWADMADIVGSLSASPDGGFNETVVGVKYEVPLRTLSCADVLITWLTLEPGTRTRENQHPGCELLLPIKGEATVEYVDDQRELCRVTAPTELAHYDSERAHRVCNKSEDETAELFVIRCYGEQHRTSPRHAGRTAAGPRPRRQKKPGKSR